MSNIILNPNTDDEIKILKEGGHISDTLLNVETENDTISSKIDFSNL